MSFLKILDELLDKNNTTVNKMCVELNIGKNSMVNWRERGNLPNGATLIKIADYFDVSTDYLLGRAQKKETQGAPLSSDEIELLEMFNAFPEAVKAHVLRYVELLENEANPLSNVFLSPAEAEKLLAVIQETFPDRSFDFRKSTG